MHRSRGWPLFDGMLERAAGLPSGSLIVARLVVALLVVRWVWKSVAVLGLLFALGVVATALDGGGPGDGRHPTSPAARPHPAAAPHRDGRRPSHHPRHR
jgi:hypothetical protein